jgi:hypothetical protein
MGRYVAKINNTYAEYGTLQWDYIKDRQPKEYYDNSKIVVEITTEDVNYKVEIPVGELKDIKLVRTKYTLESSSDKSLHRWLFNYLKEQGEKIEGCICATLHTGGLEYDSPAIDEYYLQSEIGDDDIILSTKRKVHEIKKYEDYEWLRLRFLYVAD